LAVFDKGCLMPDELPRFEHAARKALKAATGLIRYLESTPDVLSPKPPKRYECL
jgi:hypothetical protein